MRLGRLSKKVVPDLLSVTHFSALSGQDDIPENYHTLVYTLDAQGETTAVSLNQDNNSSQEEAEHSSASWQHKLESHKQHVEGAETPKPCSLVRDRHPLTSRPVRRRRRSWS